MKDIIKNKKIAIVCDWIKDWGGAELVLSHIIEIFPDADIYTSVFWQHKHPMFKNYEVLAYGQTGKTQKTKIYTSFIQKIPFLARFHKLALTMRPIAFESFNLSGYDIVISSTSAESKGIITKPDCLHICYCHTPTRYFWSHYHEYLNMMEFGILNPIAKWLMPRYITHLRRWDYIAAQRPDYFLANSKHTASRIKKYYHREVKVLYPGINIPKKQSGNSAPLKQDFYLAVGRCIPYKKFDLLVEAFNSNGKKLICVSNTYNALYKKLKKNSQPNIEWRHDVSQKHLQKLFANAKAFVFPAEEDFGLVVLEAQAHGTPVIAYGKGGALETVISGDARGDIKTRTGIFFSQQTPNSLNQGITKFESMKFDSTIIMKHARKFDAHIFQKKLKNFIIDVLSTHQENNTKD